MKRAAWVGLALAAAGVLAGFAGSRSAIADVALATYWGCESGLSFERNGTTLVRCRKAGFVDARALAPCPPTWTVNGVTVGLSASTDFSGTTDMCVGFLPRPPFPAPVPPPVTVARVCTPADQANGWNKAIRVGLDRCEKTIPEAIDYPRGQVQR